MSTTTTAYGVNLEEIGSAIGSRDQALIAQLQAKVTPDPFATDGGPTVEGGLQELITGDPPEGPTENAIKLYALEMLCEHFGTRLGGGDHISYLDDLGWQTKLLDSGPPLGLSRSDDFPDVAYLSATDVRHEYDEFSKLDSDCDVEGVEEGREELLGWLQQCAQQGLALVTFQY